jgi:dihydrofolate synthase/folylpolyglutamate synthase
VGATPIIQGRDFDVISRQVAVGGQVLALRGSVTVYDDIFVPLFGPHQAGNAACALAAVEAFLGGGPLDADIVREGFAAVRVPGRLEVVRTSPTILVDAAHNPHGARALAESIEDSFTFTRLVAVVSVLGDKDAEGLLDALVGVVDDVVVTRNSSPRAMDPDDLGAIAVSIFGDDRVEVVPSLPEAIARAVDLAEEAGDSSISGLGVLVTGSVATAGDAVRLLRGRI